jgi:hypothetical protein
VGDARPGREAPVTGTAAESGYCPTTMGVRVDRLKSVPTELIAVIWGFVVPRRTRHRVWAGRVVFCVIVVALAVHLVVVGLDTADKLVPRL